MRMVELIEKKRNGGALTEVEIAWMIGQYVNGEIPDYQIAAWLMAVCFNGMTAAETTALTMEMAHSGDMADLSEIEGIKVDKHSTGGVGDKTTLIIAPIAAACGVKVAKMSGRGLGFTGGTLDKLESIPGVQTALSPKKFRRLVQDIGAAVIGQTGNLCPADKLLYALRDVTATVDSIPLIAASIMSKKIACGTDAILLDVKTGSGAFMKTQEEAESLAREMVNIGDRAGRRTIALITEMGEPLGKCIGNTLEIMEADEVLRGSGPADLRRICILLAGRMIWLGGKAETAEVGEQLAVQALESGEAHRKWMEMLIAQGASPETAKTLSALPLSPIQIQITAKRTGRLTHIDALLCGQASVILGAGRQTKEDSIDSGAGIILHKQAGETVQRDEPIATLYTSAQDKGREAERLVAHAIEISDQPREPLKKIITEIA